MHRKFLFLTTWICGFTGTVRAQEVSESFMDKYLPIARLFDSPIFFAAVVGSAVLFLIFSFLFLSYIKKMEKRAAEWGATLEPEKLIDLLDSPISSESRAAFVYLRNYGGEHEISLLLEVLQEQRKKGKINPSIIYLLEDMEAVSAIPILQSIAKGKSKAAELAEAALSRMPYSDDEEPSPAKS
ncbi:MAG: hypothetical protein C4527_27480 [Candidatus Omnitrophota bacterium]|jgi:uncharacterized membrane protein YeaQ/YmgE (transglycosylase-associated protein family)|nr:MAG: hypothetical protein C4527_27480 [Candidatus Omnitrophota bacterium]